MSELFPTEKPTPTLPESTHLSILYGAFIEETKDTVRDHQEWISLLVGMKEGEPQNSERAQWCRYLIGVDKIYLGIAIKDLERYRREYAGL